MNQELGKVLSIDFFQVFCHLRWAGCSNLHSVLRILALATFLFIRAIKTKKNRWLENGWFEECKIHFLLLRSFVLF